MLEYNSDQRREFVNSSQRFQALRNATDREFGFRGSLVWSETSGERYLMRSYYDERGARRQKSLGKFSSQTQSLKATFDHERADAIRQRKALDEIMIRQSAINRALGLGRVPALSARIIRLLDKKRLLGHGIRIVGTNAIYAYEAACGVFVDAGLTATEDIDLLFDARARLNLISDADFPARTLLDILRLADRSFRRTRQSFRVQNDDGFLVDLIKPSTNPPWKPGRTSIGGADDIEAAEIEGLAWLENAPAFEHIAIDERGQPLRMITPDPRAFAIHKIWISARENRTPIKKARDAEQAFAIASLARMFLQHLPFAEAELRYLPRTVVQDALAAFAKAKQTLPVDR